MQIITMYPYRGRFKKIKSELICSAIYDTERDAIKYADITMYFQRAKTKNGRIRKRRYYSDSELIYLYTHIVKFFFRNIIVNSWKIIELLPEREPKIMLEIKKS